MTRPWGRRSTRLPHHDYSKPGVYFVTVQTHRNESCLGEVTDGQMNLSDAGLIVADEWVRTAVLRPYLELDEWVVMPNHVHGLIRILDAGRTGTPVGAKPPEARRFGKPQPGSIATIVRAFKSAATKRINEMRGTPGGKVRQRGYYLSVVGSARGLARVRRYIRENPRAWDGDRNNPTGG